MAAALEKEFGVKPKLVEGRDGVFDVEVGGDVVFSKAEAGRFPEEEEILRLVRERR
ncbi:MAG: Rdx family protein [Candidatus Coatesbacteria bacterium]|nr:MAG: Rdx family protein [Candidatus Coatesbacteria bacterium]